jgi:ABC-type uncharacterized transport system YnjBCD ATPase subunit
MKNPFIDLYGCMCLTLLAPKWLLLDEPFAKLDVALRTRFRALVFAHVAERGIPTLLVTHDPAVARRARRVIRMRDGKVESDGTPDQVLGTKKIESILA